MISGCLLCQNSGAVRDWLCHQHVLQDVKFQIRRFDCRSSSTAPGHRSDSPSSCGKDLTSHATSLDTQSLSSLWRQTLLHYVPN
jgi:hypothetical protein